VPFVLTHTAPEELLRHRNYTGSLDIIIFNFNFLLFHSPSTNKGVSRLAQTRMALARARVSSPSGRGDILASSSLLGRPFRYMS
jgi:hypothetical protein